MNLDTMQQNAPEGVRWHYNNDGDVGYCRANIKCPFGIPLDEHYDTAREASLAYEKSDKQEEEVVATTRKPSGVIEEFEEQNNEAPFYDISADDVEEAQKRVDRANKRLEKNGISEKFVLNVEEYEKIVKDKDGQEVLMKRAKISLNKPTISYNGFTFRARVEEPTPGSFIAYTAPGSELNGWRPDSIKCEHCNKSRRRSKVYIIENQDGEYKTIGGQCVKLYTGLSPSGLSAIEWGDDELSDLGDDEWESKGNFSRGTVVYKSDEVLKLAYVLSKDTGYKSSQYGLGTKDQVMRVLNPFTTEDKKKAPALKAEAEKVDIEPIKKDILAAIEGNNGDWATNIRTIMNSERTDWKTLGILVSSMAAVHKYQAEKKRQPWAKGFIGAPGEKVENVKATVRKIYFDSTYYGGVEQEVKKIEMQTESGHKVFWSTSAGKTPEEGEKIVFKATIKDTSTWKEVDSTRIKNAKWVKDEE